MDDFLLTANAPKGEPAYPLTVGAIGLTTFASYQAYVVPEGLKGGIVTVTGDKATVEYIYEAGDVVPAEEAVVLNGTPNDYTLVLTDEEGTKFEENLLRPALTMGTLNAESGELLYILANDKARGLGFYFQGSDSDGKSVSNIYGKGYLAVSDAAGVRGFSLAEGTATDIDHAVQNTADGAIYTLSGTRVSTTGTQGLPAGIYIAGGRKVLVK